MQSNYWQGLIKKQKVHIFCEKGAQISIFTYKIATQWWPNIIIKESRRTNITFIYYFPLLCSHYVIDLIKNLETRLMVVSIFLKIKFKHGQISVPKIGISMSKTAYINPSLTIFVGKKLLCRLLWYHQDLCIHF